MPSHSRLNLAASLLALFACARFLAEAQNYHVEIVPPQTAPEPASAAASVNLVSQERSVILVNDSQKPIEAFRALMVCQSESNTSRLEVNFDALENPASVVQFLGTDKTTIRSGLEPGDQWRMTGVLRARAECKWKAVNEAAIYADGTYEGDKIGLRNLEARRDGIAAAVKYWSDQFEHADLATLNASTILAAASRRDQQDNVQLNQRIAADPNYRQNSDAASRIPLIGGGDLDPGTIDRGSAYGRILPHPGQVSPGSRRAFSPATP